LCLFHATRGITRRNFLDPIIILRCRPLWDPLKYPFLVVKPAWHGSCLVTLPAPEYLLADSSLDLLAPWYWLWLSHILLTLNCQDHDLLYFTLHSCCQQEENQPVICSSHLSLSLFNAVLPSMKRRAFDLIALGV